MPFSHRLSLNRNFKSHNLRAQLPTNCVNLKYIVNITFLVHRHSLRKHDSKRQLYIFGIHSKKYTIK